MRETMKRLMILAMAGICSSASACCGPDGHSVKMEHHYKARPDCNLEKKVFIKPPPPSPPVTVKYICGKCEREFKYSKETPYCTECTTPPVKKVVVMPQESQPEIVYVRPPSPPPCPMPPQVFVPRRGQIFLEFPPAYAYPRESYRESFHESHTSSRTWERSWFQ